MCWREGITGSSHGRSGAFRRHGCDRIGHRFLVGHRDRPELQGAAARAGMYFRQSRSRDGKRGSGSVMLTGLWVGAERLVTGVGPGETSAPIGPTSDKRRGLGPQV